MRWPRLGRSYDKCVSLRTVRPNLCDARYGFLRDPIMPDTIPYLLIGGYAAAQAAFAIREREQDAQIVLLCAEKHPPYQRPPLSKQMLFEEGYQPDNILEASLEEYAAKNIELRMGAVATKIDRAERQVQLLSGEVLNYDKLLFAPGAQAKKPDMPGAALSNVYYIRTLEDGVDLRNAIAQGGKAVVIGGSYLGLEAASGCLKRGVDVTIVDSHPGPWAKFASEGLQQFLKSEFEKRSAHLIFDEKVAGISGEDKATGVPTSGGEVACDFVVAATGATLNTELAKDAGLEVDKTHGIVVDETLRTQDPHIWVAGDCACYPDKTVGKPWHAEHYMNALWQGKLAGRNMTGANEAYDEVPYFFSDLLDLHMVLRGSPGAGKSKAVVGSMERGEFVELYADEEGTLKMAVALTHDAHKSEAVAAVLARLVRGKPAATSLDEKDFEGFFS